MALFRNKRKRQERDGAERAHDLTLEQAESTLRDLTTRGEQAVRTLDDRDRRNHWRESIQSMIQGV